METEAGTTERIRCTTPGESAPIKLLAAWATWAGEGTKRRTNQVSAFVEYLKTGTARKARPAPYKAAGSLSSVDGDSTHPWAGANPAWREHCECSPPHTHQWYLSAAPLPCRSATEQANLNKRPPPPACVRVEIRPWRDQQIEAK